MSLAINYLSKVSVAEHDGLVRQILGKLQASGISHEMFIQRLAAYAARVAEEDEAYRQSQKDFTSDRLKSEDDLCDMYAKAVRAILNGHAEIPESEPNRQLAVELLQVFKDYKFSPSDTYTAEADKVRNMNQVFQTRLADLETLGVKDYWTQVVAHATNVEQLLAQRFDALAAQSAGAMKTARTNTDQALKSVYELLAAMNVMAPSAELTSLITEGRFFCYMHKGRNKKNRPVVNTVVISRPDGCGTPRWSCSRGPCPCRSTRADTACPSPW